MGTNALILLGCGKSGRSEKVKTLVWQENGDPASGDVYETYYGGLSPAGGAYDLNTLSWVRTKTAGNGTTDCRFKWDDTNKHWYVEAAAAASYRQADYDIALTGHSGIEYKCYWKYLSGAGSGASSHEGVRIGTSGMTNYIWLYNHDAGASRAFYVIVDGVTVYSATTLGTSNVEWIVSIEPDGDYSISRGGSVVATGNVSWVASLALCRVYGYTETGTNIGFSGATTNGWYNERISTWI